jgi:glycosyltransferase involved in cell wall biosynthesis
MSRPLQIMLASAGGGWIHRAAAELLQLGHEAYLYSPAKNSPQIPTANFHRARPFNLACQPYYRFAGGRYAELGYHLMFPIWQWWFQRQHLPLCDVVHAVMGSAIEPFAAAEKMGALKVLDASNSHPTSFYGFWQRELDLWNPRGHVSVPRRVYARANREIQAADLVLCASTYVRDSMRYNGVPEEKLTVNPFGVDRTLFVSRERPPVTPRFLFVGGLTLRKGLQYLIPAFEQIRTLHPTAELVLCGAVHHADFAPLYRRWRHLFTHHRSLPHPELAKLMRTCSAFVFPSLEEGFARVIAEAMSVGLPIIATHNSGATSVVEDGKQGIIVPVASMVAVRDAMLKMIGEPELCHAMGQAAAARMAEAGSWRHYAQRLVAAYQAHCGGSNRRLATKSGASCEVDK